MADIVVSEGYAAVGYEYINIDDCWLEKERGFNGQLVPDRNRFPYGMKNLANYVRYPKKLIILFYCLFSFLFIHSFSFLCAIFLICYHLKSDIFAPLYCQL